MPTLFRRPILTVAVGFILAAAAFAGSAAYGALSEPTVNGCYVPKTGSLYVIGRDGAPERCGVGHLPIGWAERGPQGPVGPQGPAGVFSGTFTSPNGAYSISVTNTGIQLTGPGSSVRVAGAGVTVEGAATATLRGGAVAVNGGTTTVDGAVVRLNGAAGCVPIVRTTDVIPVPEHAGATFAAAGSPTVCAG
jgi:hypothetical protein